MVACFCPETVESPPPENPQHQRVEGLTMPEYGLNRNKEGYSDPTAHAALSNVIREESEQQRRVSALIGVLKYIIDAAGFDLLARIEIRDRKTGREYR